MFKRDKTNVKEDVLRILIGETDSQKKVTRIQLCLNGGCLSGEDNVDAVYMKS